MNFKAIPRLSAAFALLCATAACTPNDIGLGDSAKQNYAAQVVNPDPQYAGPMAANGDQTGQAQQRYRTGTVKPPQGIKTTSGSGGSSGSGSGSSSGGSN